MVHAYVIHQHLLRKRDAAVRTARPVAANRQIEDQEERLVELIGTVDAVLDNAVRVDIEVLHPVWWEGWGIKFGWLPAKRTYNIKPATLGTMIRISKLLLEIEIESLKTNTSALDANYKLYDQHGEHLAQVVAIAIQNNKEQPDKKLVRFLQNNLTGKELFSITQVVVKQLDVLSFMSTIISIRGVSLLNPGGTIASGGPSAD